MDFSPYTRLFEFAEPRKRRTLEKTFEIINEVFDLEHLKDTSIFSDCEKIDEIFHSSSKHSGCTSASKYQTRKYAVLDFYVWLMNRNIVSEDTVMYIRNLCWERAMSDKDIANYFRDISDLLDYIESIGKIALQDKSGSGSPDRIFIALKAFVSLLWYGVSADECAELKLESINSGSRSVTTKTRTVPIGYRAFEEICKYAKAYDYTGPSGRSLSFVPSLFVFRSKRKERMSESDLWEIVKEFNVIATEVSLPLSRPHKLDVKQIERNGIIARAFSIAQQNPEQRETNAHIKNVLSKCADLSSPETSRMIHLYKRWVEYFYN